MRLSSIVLAIIAVAIVAMTAWAVWDIFFERCTDIPNTIICAED